MRRTGIRKTTETLPARLHNHRTGLQSEGQRLYLKIEGLEATKGMEGVQDWLIDAAVREIHEAISRLQAAIKFIETMKGK